MIIGIIYIEDNLLREQFQKSGKPHFSTKLKENVKLKQVIKNKLRHVLENGC